MSMSMGEDDGCKLSVSALDSIFATLSSTYEKKSDQ
jgi:hypothetical protein